MSKLVLKIIHSLVKVTIGIWNELLQFGQFPEYWTRKGTFYNLKILYLETKGNIYDTNVQNAMR